MTLSFRPPDTIAWRFSVTIVAALAATCLLIGLFLTFGGLWARPPMDAAARLEGAWAIVHMMEAAPPDLRPKLAHVATTKTYQLDWYAPGSSVSFWLNTVQDDQGHLILSDELNAFSHNIQRIVRVIVPFDPLWRSVDFPLRSDLYPEARFFAIRLEDNSWLVFTGFTRDWGLSQRQRLMIWAAFLALSCAVVSAISSRQLSRPIRQFASAVRLAGLNPHAPPIRESGPQELREVIAAFNKMHGQIQEFVAYRTAMLAAISHDLRTPLTRMRLRGEFMQDKTQQARLFRDVDEMQAMIDGALAFFRGDANEEENRPFDLPGILLSITDDYADQGVEIRYSGPDHLVYNGRPLALKRAFTNLIENAVKYGTPPQVELCCGKAGIAVTVRDEGPGIPSEAMETVFKPFYRLDRSRNRATGGAGLGLTAAQAIIRGHGGDIVLRNQPAGGLEAVVTLPQVS